MIESLYEKTSDRATIAFIFNKDLSQVLLIRKRKPEEHKGLLNGLGGKLEPGETDRECVVREVYEESGYDLKPKAIHCFGVMNWSNWQVSMWAGMVDQSELHAQPEAGVAWYPLDKLPSTIISNISWLIPLAADVLQKSQAPEKELPWIDLRYKSKST